MIVESNERVLHLQHIIDMLESYRRDLKEEHLLTGQKLRYKKSTDQHLSKFPRPQRLG